jgi:hypothetical protein
MYQRNDGIGEDNALQNEFTAYFVTAIQRKKSRYLRGRENRQNRELLSESERNMSEPCYEPDMLSALPIIAQLENFRLAQALARQTERDLYIFFAKALRECSFVEIAVPFLEKWREKGDKLAG